jgi:nickel transport protein
MRSLFLCLVFTLLCQAPALAHRVNVFAFVEGGEIVVECSYSKSKRVKNGLITVFDKDSGATLLQGTTDEEGLFRFPVPQQARLSGSSLRILLEAGEGHQNEWIVEASEFKEAKTPAAAAPKPAVTAESGSGESAPSRPEAALTRADVEEVVAAQLDAKLAPIRRTLLEQSQRGPGLEEIIGGIGWIFGLVGIAAYFKSRPRV